MHERPEDLAELQRVIDDSYDAAGPHLLGISTPDRRLTAGHLAEQLTGMRLLALATTGPWTASSIAAAFTSAPPTIHFVAGTCRNAQRSVRRISPANISP